MTKRYLPIGGDPNACCSGCIFAALALVCLVLALWLSSCGLSVGPDFAARPTSSPPTMTTLERCQLIAMLVRPDGLVIGVRVNPENGRCEVVTTKGKPDEWVDLSFYLPENPTQTPVTP